MVDLRGKSSWVWPLLICVLAVSLSTADQSLFSYAIPEITKEFGIPLSVIGQILSVSFLFASFTVVVAGLAGDEYGRARVLGILLFLSALCVGAHALVESLAAVAALRILGFAIGAGVYPITNTIVAELASPRLRGLLSGCLQMGYPIGFVVASAISTPIIGDYGWRAIFYPAFAIAFLAPVLAWVLRRHETRVQAERSVEVAVATDAGGSRRAMERLRVLISGPYRRRFIICFAGSFLVSLAIGGTTYLLPTYLVEAHHVDVAAAGRIAGISYAIGALGYLSAALVGEFVTTRRNTLVLWVWLGAIAFALTLWVAESRIALVLGLGASILFFYGSEAVRAPLIAEIFPHEIRATAAATTGSLAVTAAWLVSPLLISTLVPIAGWAWTFTLLGVTPLVLGGCVFALLFNVPSGLSIDETTRRAGGDVSFSAPDQA